MLDQRRRGATVGSCSVGRGGGKGRCGRGGTRGRGGGSGRGLDRGWFINWGCFGSSRLVVVHLEDVLLEVSDPVLLYWQRTVKLHLTEPVIGTKNTLKSALGLLEFLGKNQKPEHWERSDCRFLFITTHMSSPFNKLYFTCFVWYTCSNLFHFKTFSIFYLNFLFSILCKFSSLKPTARRSFLVKAYFFNFVQTGEIYICLKVIV